MTVLPFISIGIGLIIALIIKDKRLQYYADKLTTFVLIVLMLCIGLNIGLDQTIVDKFFNIGFNCIVMALLSIAFSVVVVYIGEKLAIDLDKLGNTQQLQEESISTETEGNHLVVLMPLSVIAGIIIGIFSRHSSIISIIDIVFTITLALLYILVGISQGENIQSLRQLKGMGMRLFVFPIGIIIGSIISGIISSFLLGLPIEVTVIAASGVSYYSLTGAFMTNYFGVEYGAYGFLVNILREVFTILLLPLLIRISKGSPIASGGAGNMDTMLAPVVKFVGKELAFVTLFTGTILTIAVPFILPLIKLMVS